MLPEKPHFMLRLVYVYAWSWPTPRFGLRLVLVYTVHNVNFINLFE